MKKLRLYITILGISIVFFSGCTKDITEEGSKEIEKNIDTKVEDEDTLSEEIIPEEIAPEEIIPEEIAPEEIIPEEIPQEEIVQEIIPEEEMEGWNVKADGFYDEPIPEERFNKGYLLTSTKKDMYGNEEYWMDFETYYLSPEEKKLLPQYEDLIRYPERYIDEYVQFGPLKVSQIIKEEGNYYELLVQLVQSGSSPIVIGGDRAPGEARIIEKDYITFGGYYKGLMDATYQNRNQKIPVIKVVFAAQDGYDMHPKIALQDWFNNKIYVIEYRDQLVTCIDEFSEEIEWSIPKDDKYRATDINIMDNGELFIQGENMPLNVEGFEMVVNTNGEIVSMRE